MKSGQKNRQITEKKHKGILNRKMDPSSSESTFFLEKEGRCDKDFQWPWDCAKHSWSDCKLNQLQGKWWHHLPNIQTRYFFIEFFYSRICSLWVYLHAQNCGCAEFLLQYCKEKQSLQTENWKQLLKHPTLRAGGVNPAMSAWCSIL